MQAEAFANQTANAVAVMRTAQRFFGNGHSQAGIACFIRGSAGGQPTFIATLALLENPLEFSRAGKTYMTREAAHPLLACFDTKLWNQAGTALGTTGAQDFTAIRSRHAGTETVGTGAVQLARLKGSFHDKSPNNLLNSSLAYRKKSFAFEGGQKGEAH